MTQKSSKNKKKLQKTTILGDKISWHIALALIGLQKKVSRHSRFIPSLSTENIARHVGCSYKKAESCLNLMERSGWISCDRNLPRYEYNLLKRKIRTRFFVYVHFDFNLQQIPARIFKLMSSGYESTLVEYLSRVRKASFSKILAYLGCTKEHLHFIFRRDAARTKNLRIFHEKIYLKFFRGRSVFSLVAKIFRNDSASRSKRENYLQKKKAVPFLRKLASLAFPNSPPI